MDALVFLRIVDEISVFHVGHLDFKHFKDDFGVKTKVFGLDLSAAVEASARAGHNLHVIIVALPPLDVPDYVLNVSESVGGSEAEDDLAVQLEDALLQIFVFARDVLERLSRVNAHAENLPRGSPKYVL